MEWHGCLVILLFWNEVWVEIAEQIQWSFGGLLIWQFIDNVKDIV